MLHKQNCVAEIRQDLGDVLKCEYLGGVNSFDGEWSRGYRRDVERIARPIEPTEICRTAGLGPKVRDHVDFETRILKEEVRCDDNWLKDVLG